MPMMIDIDSAVVTMLVETRWLAEADAAERAKIGAALTAMLLDAAAKYR